MSVGPLGHQEPGGTWQRGAQGGSGSLLRGEREGPKPHPAHLSAVGLTKTASGTLCQEEQDETPGGPCSFITAFVLLHVV